MRASGSTSAFGRLPWPQARARAQFHPEPRLDVKRSAQRPDACKPFFEERTERTSAALTEISFAPLRLLPRQFLLQESDKPVHPGSRALVILIVLLEHPGELISKQELIARVWPNVFVGPSNLTVHMSALRRVLDGRDGNRFIINIPRRGYGFVASVNVAGRLEADGRESRAALRAESSTLFAAGWWSCSAALSATPVKG
jgi:DNA-binding winged helix-turn-helix (wHTH) protein